jgi:hypothetical protein
MAAVPFFTVAVRVTAVPCVTLFDETDKVAVWAEVFTACATASDVTAA